ncbi:MAG: NADH-quinone oxidoreductase subunit NuoN [Alphaproteobacteria bacterium]
MNNPQITDFIAFIPELFLAVAAMTLLVVGILKRPLSETGNDVSSFNLVTFLAIATLVVTTLLVAISVKTVIFMGQLSTESFPQFMKLIAIIAATITLLNSRPWLIRNKMQRFEYSVLLMFAVLGMMIMISSRHLLLTYLGLELQSLALYVLAASRRSDGKSSEAGLKYFILGAVSSGILLYGISMVFGAAGNLSYGDIATAIATDANNKLALTGMVLIIIAASFKVSAVPFHMWTPDVYEGAPTPVTAFFAVAPKIAAFAVLITLLTGPFASVSHDWMLIIGILAALSMILGSIGAIAQTSLKRLMAYSSIGHIGYAFIGIAAGEDGVQATILYLVIYAIMNMGVFAIILGLYRDGKPADKIADLAGFAKTHKLLAACMAILMFSMAGIPPLFGFAGKLAVFQAALSNGAGWLLGLAIIGILTSAIAAYYYLRIIKVMFFDESEKPLDEIETVEVTTIALIASAIIVLMLPFTGIVMNLIEMIM